MVADARAGARIVPAAVAPLRLGALAQWYGMTLRETPRGALQGVRITGIASDNRSVWPGDAFAALPGAVTHGARFAADAVARGAVAIITDDDGAAILAGSGLGALAPILVLPDVPERFPALATQIYGFPGGSLTSYAITGTNGKTTTAYMLQHLLGLLGRRAGLIGTVETRFGDQVFPARLTTPDAADLQAILATMVEAGMDSVVMEASSHALALRRVDGIQFQVAGFTNLSQDHLDFHGTMADYFDAKAKLFTFEHSDIGVVSVDDKWGRRLANESEVAAITVGTCFGDSAGALRSARWQVREVEQGRGGSRFTIIEDGGYEIPVTISLPGTFNVQNAALAVVMAYEGIMAADGRVDPTDITAALGGGFAPVVPGRMEVIEAGDAATPRVIVDFAHNTEALSAALGSLSGARDSGKLYVLFGAAGDRDQGKRPAMGAAAVAGADVVYLTDDDPHGEDPTLIRAAVRAGIEQALANQPKGAATKFVEIGDRREAIAAVIAAAAPGDTVLIAGRGHETTQPWADGDVPLDDRIEARAALAARSKRAVAE